MKKKLIILLLVLTIFPILVLEFGVTFPRMRKFFIDNGLAQQEQSLGHDSDLLRSVVNNFQKETLLVSLYPPIQGLIRSEDTGIDPLDQSTFEMWKKQLQSIFYSELLIQDSIFQFRYLNNLGREVVRVEKKGETIYVTPEYELQDKSDRYYFQETAKIPKGTFYSSSLDLNMEYGDIQIPHTPVFRLATPVFDERNEEFKGVIVVNFFGKVVLDNFLDDVGTKEESFLIDHEGQYLAAQSPEKLFGAQLGHGHNFFKEFPEFPSLLSENEKGIYYNRDSPSWVIWKKFHYGESIDEYWVLIKVVEEEVVLAPLISLRFATFYTTFFFVVVIVLASIVAGKYFTYPLHRLSGVVSAMGRGNLNVEVPKDLLSRGDEVSSLAKTFSLMAKRLRDIYGDLESEIKDKTHKLQQQNESLGDIQKALANVLEDISKEKNVLEKQVLETEKFKQAADVSTDAVMITDLGANIIYVNRAWTKLNGYSAREALKLNANILKSDKTSRELYDRIWERIRKGLVFQSEGLVNKKKNGETYNVDLAIVPLKSGNKVVFYLGVSQDITKRKEVERAKSEFVSLASHQLRTPLTAIKWFTDLMVDDDYGKLTKDQGRFVQEIRNSTEQMIVLVSSLLDVSRIDAGTLQTDYQEVDIREIAEGVLIELTPELDRKKIALSKRFPEEISTIISDPKFVKIIIQNLLSNAVKYTPKAGEVEIEIVEKKTVIQLLVKDTGCGIPERQQDKIFSKLFRADNVQKRDVEGNGLGLYLVKSIIEQWGGKISFKSIEDKGTAFTVSIPKTKRSFKKI